MQQTSNTFLKGLNSDMHPLTTSQQEYIDALNATLITYNGNEQMLQNDMGNTRIQDAKTGNIMGLREGRKQSKGILLRFVGFESG